MYSRHWIWEKEVKLYEKCRKKENQHAGDVLTEVKEALQDFIIRACKETASDKEVEVLPEAVLAYIELLLKS
nr:MAG TPA: hypothetical protein [Caudoviricetes sp.]